MIDEELQKAIYLIKTAKDTRGCSAGQLHLAKFIRACLNYNSRANIKEILFREDLGKVCAFLKVAESGELLRKLVEEHNPALLNEDEEW